MLQSKIAAMNAALQHTATPNCGIHGSAAL